MRLPPVLVGLVLIAAAILGDASVPTGPRAPRGSVPSVPAGGVLSCPIATTGEGEAHLYLANVGEDTGRARVVIRTASGKVILKRVGLGAGSLEAISLHRMTDEPSGVAVEWSGGRILAAHALQRDRDFVRPGLTLPRFVSVAQCLETQGPELALAAARTTQIGDTTLSLFNPGPAPADVSIAVRISGVYTEPQRLQRRIIRPLSRRDFSLRDFAFGRDEIAVIVRMNSGRVAAEAYIENRGGAELVTATPPMPEALVLAGRSGEGVRLSVAATERYLGTDSSNSASPIEIPLSLSGTRYGDGVETDPEELPKVLGPGAPGAISVPSLGDRRPVGYELRPVSGRLTAAVSWSTEGELAYDLVAVSAAVPSTTWFGILPTFGDQWSAEMLVAAAAGEEATAELRVLGPRPRTSSVDLPPGTVRRVTISGGAGVHAVVVNSEVPIVTSYIARSGGIAYGTSGTSLKQGTATALDPQPVVGIGSARN